jgi:hypothetical protein
MQKEYKGNLHGMLKTNTSDIEYNLCSRQLDGRVRSDIAIHNA